MSNQYIRRVGRVAVVVTAAALLLSGCGRADAPPAPQGSGDASGAADAIATAPGFDGETIKIGAIAVTSGPFSQISAPSLAAAQAWEQYTNANGGIEGYRVELTVVDSGFNPAQALQQYATIKPDVAMIGLIFGTPITASLLPQLEQDQIFAIGQTGDGTLFRYRELALAFTPTESQLLNAVGYFQDNGGKSDSVVCGAGLEGPNVETLERTLDYAVDSMDVNLGTSVSLSATVTDATPQVLQLQASECDVVVIAATNNQTVPLMSAASKLGYAPRFITTVTGFNGLKADDPLYGYAEKNLWQVADTVPYGDESAEGMGAMVEAHDAYAKDTPPNIPFELGWINMLQVESILKQAIQNKDLSQSGIVEAANQLDTFDLKGIGPKWGFGEPADRTPPSGFSVYKPDGSSPTLLAGIDSDVTSPEAALQYPY